MHIFKEIFRDRKVLCSLLKKFEDFYQNFDWAKLYQNYQHISQQNHLIQKAVVLEKFLLKKFLSNGQFIQPSDVNIDFVLLNQQINQDKNFKKQYLNQFSEYFKQKISPEKLLEQDMLRKEFAQYAQKNNDFSFEGLRNAQITNAHLHYCLICHERNKDSCRHGMGINNKAAVIRKDADVLDDNPIQDSYHKHLDKPGCPLEMHISEAIWLKKNNFNLAALAVMMINNPVLILTGYRICNDCSKSCIFGNNNLASVDVPLLETRILQDILDMRYGPEIYLLLTQFNPLRNSGQQIAYQFKQQLQSRKIAIVGAGVAGLSAAYYLNFYGYEIEIFEAVQLNFQNNPIIKKFKKNLIKNGKKFFQRSLENRCATGLGGVAEYGITKRWNKNYLDLLALLFLRQSSKKIKFHDGIRLGQNTNMDLQNLRDRYANVVLAIGASKQKWPAGVKMRVVRPDARQPNKNFTQIYFAADFLMRLHLYGLYKITNLNHNLELHLRLPIVVIGGGLTAIDSAAQLVNYFFRQLEKLNIIFAKNINFKDDEANLVLDDDVYKDVINKYDLNLLNQYLYSYNQLKQQDFSLSAKIQLLNNLGGVKVLLNREINQSKAYNTNHEEILHAQSLGVQILTNHQLLQIDQLEDIYRIHCKYGQIVQARQIFMAVGMELNELSLSENKITGQQIRSLDEKNFFLDGQVSLVGDAHPFYRGSVVQAINSAAKMVNQMINIDRAKKDLAVNTSGMTDLSVSKPRVDDIRNHVKDLAKQKDNFKDQPSLIQVKLFKQLQILRLIIRVPSSSLANFTLGQFFKIQIYVNNLQESEVLLAPIALTPVYLDHHNSQIHFLINLSDKNINIDKKFKIDDIGNSNLKYFLYLANKRSYQKNKIICMGPLGGNLNFGKIAHEQRLILIIYSDDKFALYTKLLLLQNWLSQPGKSVSVILLDRIHAIKSGVKNNTIKLYQNKIDNLVGLNYHLVDSSESLKELLVQLSYKPISLVIGFSFEEYNLSIQGLDGNHCDKALYNNELAAIDKNYLSVIQKYLIKYKINVWGSLPVKMQCMMKGLCGRCVSFEKFTIHDGGFDSIHNSSLDVIHNEKLNNIHNNSIDAMYDKRGDDNFYYDKAKSYENSRFISDQYNAMDSLPFSEQTREELVPIFACRCSQLVPLSFINTKNI